MLLQRQKNKITILLLLLVAAGVLIPEGAALAADSIGANIADGIAWVLVMIVGPFLWLIDAVIGALLVAVIAIVVSISQYNDFIISPAIINGWSIVRGVCNMFFILILLGIALATSFRIEGYSAKQLLGKLVLMAILINFSKMIYGVIIDAGQVVMLTFVNAYNNGGGNYLDMLGIAKYMDVGDVFLHLGNPNGLDGRTIAIGLFLSTFFLVVSFILMLVIAAVLLMRIVMLWIAVIMSPLVFLLWAFPAGKGRADQMFGDFIKNVTIGPILAFFIWLALLTAKTGGARGSNPIPNPEYLEDFCGGPNEIMCMGSLISYATSVGLLFGGLMAAQQMGGAVGAVAQKVRGYAQEGLKKGGKIAGMALMATSPAQKGLKLGYDAVIGALGKYQDLGEKTPFKDYALKAESWMRMKRESAEKEATAHKGFASEERLLEQVNRLRIKIMGTDGELKQNIREDDRQNFQQSLEELTRRGARVPFGSRVKDKDGNDLYERDDKGNLKKDEAGNYISIKKKDKDGKEIKTVSEEAHNFTQAQIAQAELMDLSIDAETGELTATDAAALEKFKKNLADRFGDIDNEALIAFFEAKVKKVAKKSGKDPNEIKASLDYYDKGTGELNPLKYIVEKKDSIGLKNTHERFWTPEVLEYMDDPTAIAYAGKRGNERQRKKAVEWAQQKDDEEFKKVETFAELEQLLYKRAKKEKEPSASGDTASPAPEPASAPQKPFVFGPDGQPADKYLAEKQRKQKLKQATDIFRSVVTEGANEIKIDFSDLGLDAALDKSTLKGEEKAKIAVKIGELAKNRGVDGAAIEDKIKELDSVTLSNANIEGGTVRPFMGAPAPADTGMSGSEITGTRGLLEQGKNRLAVDFSQLDFDKIREKIALDPSFDPSQAKGLSFTQGEAQNNIAKIIADALRAQGKAEEAAKAEKAIQEQPSFVLVNKGAEFGKRESRMTYAHERMHTRLPDDAVQSAWQAMPEDARKKEWEKIKQTHGDNISEKDAAHEYMANALMSKTKWSEKDASGQPKTTLHPSAEKALEDRIAGGIQALISNITAPPLASQGLPQAGDNAQISAQILNQLTGIKEGLGNVVQACLEIGNGPDKIADAARSHDAEYLARALEENSSQLQAFSRGLEANTRALNLLTRKTR